MGMEEVYFVYYYDTMFVLLNHLLPVTVPCPLPLAGAPVKSMPVRIRGANLAGWGDCHDLILPGLQITDIPSEIKPPSPPLGFGRVCIITCTISPGGGCIPATNASCAPTSSITPSSPWPWPSARSSRSPGTSVPSEPLSSSPSSSRSSS
jgi:hypothetical protein